MTNGASIPSQQDRDTRVSREVDLLREQGYQADSNPSPPYQVVTVQTQRAAEPAPQPVTIYFALDSSFPNSVPIMELRLASGQFTPNGEVRDFMIDLDSKKRVEWNSASHLYQIVQDIDSAVQDEKNLHIKHRSDWPIERPASTEEPISAPAPPPIQRTEPLSLPPSVPVRWRNYLLPIALGALLLGLALIALIPWMNRPPSTQEQVDQLWQEVAPLEGAYTPDSMEQLVALLDRIRNLDPLARSPDKQIAVTELLVQARVKWGDLLYPRERAAAAAQYQAARVLDSTSLTVTDRLAWLERDTMIRTANIVTWPESIAELRKGVEQDPNQHDPENKSIKEWLYQAYIRYGQVLLANPDDLQQANMALQQAEAAIALAAEIHNDGVAAKELKRQAQSRIIANSKYRFAVEPQTQVAWDTLLSVRKITVAQDGRSINLLVLGSSEQTLTLLGPQVAGAPDASKTLTTSNTGEATDTLEPGGYTLQLQDGDTALQTKFTISADSPYVMVRVIEQR